jgi:hypothetical protein
MLGHLVALDATRHAVFDPDSECIMVLQYPSSSIFAARYMLPFAWKLRRSYRGSAALIPAPFLPCCKLDCELVSRRGVPFASSTTP